MVRDEHLKYLVVDSLEPKKHEHERKQRRKSNRSDVFAMGLHENDNCCLETGYCCAIRTDGVNTGCLLGILDIASFRLPYGYHVAIGDQESC